jgi:hypothetical protein
MPHYENNGSSLEATMPRLPGGSRIKCCKEVLYERYGGDLLGNDASVSWDLVSVFNVLPDASR